MPATCVLAYCLLAVVAYWPVSPFSSSRIMHCGCMDAAQEAWFLSWPVFAVFHAYNPLYTNWIGYPYGVNLAANTAMPLLGVIAFPVTALAGPVAAYNFLLRLGFAASATSAFFVLRRWTRWPPAAFVGGLLYGFSPFLVGEGQGHAFLTFAPLPPLIFLVLSELLLAQRRPAWQSGLALGALAVAQLYISPEILVTTLLMAGLAVLLSAAARPRLVGSRVRHALTGLGWATVLFLVLGGYDVWFFLEGAQHIVGPPHRVAALAPYHADLLSAVIPTHSQLFAPSALARLGDRLTGFDITETGAYIGIPLLLLLIALVARYRRDPRVRLAAALAICAYVLSMGAQLEVDGHKTHVPLPFAVLQHVPIVQGAVAGRFSLFTNFFIAVLLSLGLSRVRTDDRLAAISQRRLTGATGALALTAVCLIPLVPNFPYPEVAPRVPRFFTSRAVGQVPAGSVMLIYPYPYWPDNQGMLWAATAHLRFRIIGDYAAVPGPRGTSTSVPLELAPPQAEELFRASLLGPRQARVPLPPFDQATLTALRQFVTLYGVQTIVVAPIGRSPRTVISYLTAALHAPPRAEGGVEVWFGAQRLASAA